MDESDHIPPPPPYRHAVAAGPWPWVDTSDNIDQTWLNIEAAPVPKDCNHRDCDGECWKGYPQSRFPNWTPNQLIKSNIFNAITTYDPKKNCVIYKLDVDCSGIFHDAGVHGLSYNAALVDDEWGRLLGDNQKSDVRVRALFVEKMAGPALRMVGAKYNIEPVFFSSSLNWIPSQYQEDLRPSIGDHITITLPFVQSIDAEVLHHECDRKEMQSLRGHRKLLSQTIDTQAPLKLGSKTKALIIDLLSVHLIRNTVGNTLISFHADMNLPTTKAYYLHERIRYAGLSVYWQRVLKRTDDPTFFLLIFLWHTMYAWDESLQHLYEDICATEMDLIRISSTSNDFTDRLHATRAHLLYYSSLLAAFKRTVDFISNTPNPALTRAQKGVSAPLLRQECATLLGEIDRLDKECTMQEKRLKHIVDLVDNRTLHRMTEATIGDSAVIKQIAVLTMIFLPATFMAGFFGMHSPGATTLSLYFEATCGLTVVTIWVLIAFQCSRWFNIKEEMTFWQGLRWPVYLVNYAVKKVDKKLRAKPKGEILPM
ncbi:cora-like Mg2+ transporter protein-domain-containing protein [Amanita rubescens]|nr:cora-like Mg2+ transporter protein-domain-containing protein [Amanita rubescens]